MENCNQREQECCGHVFTRSQNKTCHCPQNPRNTLEWSQTLASRGKNITNMLRKSFVQLPSALNRSLSRSSALNLKNKQLLYKTILRLIITYAVPVWDSACRSRMNEFERMQSKFKKYKVTRDILSEMMTLEHPSVSPLFKILSGNWPNRTTCPLRTIQTRRCQISKSMTIPIYGTSTDQRQLLPYLLTIRLCLANVCWPCSVHVRLVKKKRSISICVNIFCHKTISLTETTFLRYFPCLPPMQYC